MKTVFILTYYILMSTNINKLEIDVKQETCSSFQQALDVYNKASREAYTIQPDIAKKDQLVDTLKVDLALDTVIDINYGDSIHNILER